MLRGCPLRIWFMSGMLPFNKSRMKELKILRPIPLLPQIPIKSQLLGSEIHCYPLHPSLPQPLHRALFSPVPIFVMMEPSTVKMSQI